MSQFTYEDYQKYQKDVASAQNKTSRAKIGFFKLKDDNDEALVRLDVKNLDDLTFNTVHVLQANGKWMRVTCLNKLSQFEDNCELCKAVKDGNTAIGRALKKVYIRLLASYKDKATGAWAPAVPVVWECPATMSSDIASKIKNFGNLQDVIFVVTRHGVAGDRKTTYTIEYVPIFNKPEFIPSDFSAFENFDLSKHSFWVKSAEDLHTFLTTGNFPVKDTTTYTDATSYTTESTIAASATPKTKTTGVWYNQEVEPTTAIPASTINSPTESATTPVDNSKANSDNPKSPFQFF